ncbi:MAG TPA: hypothetical protein VGX78_14860, partial [Pirellulales bacterium]|nr:hypothetical protein [Pirellulales bacterium]
MQREQKYLQPHVSGYVAPAWSPSFALASKVGLALVCLVGLLIAREVLARQSAKARLAPDSPQTQVVDLNQHVDEVKLYAVECYGGGELPKIATISTEFESAQRGVEMVNEFADARGLAAQRARLVAGVWRPYADKATTPPGDFEVVIVTDQGDARATISGVEFTGDLENAENYARTF